VRQVPLRAGVRPLPRTVGGARRWYPRVEERGFAVKTQRSRDWLRLLAPQALAGRAAGPVVAAACLVVLGLILLIDKVTPPAAAMGALSFIPVLVAVWLLSGSLAALVTIAAILLRIVAVFVDDVHPLTVLAEVVTIAIVAGLARFAAVVVTAYWSAQAMAEERERIARELHDGTIQSLFAVGIGLRTARSPARRLDLAQSVDEALQELDHIVRDLRSYVFGLRPQILADRQLGPALEQLVHDLEARWKIAVQTEIDSMVAAGLAAKAADVVQLSREALSNVGRHSLARHCWLTLRRAGAAAILEIRDDGRGFNVNDVSRTGQGLVNMQRRAAALGGQATIVTNRGQGASVRITIPMDGAR